MSLVGFKAKNHPQQTARRGADDTVDERITPDEIFTPLDQEHHFTIDVAANWFNSKCNRYIPIERDGLRRSAS